MIGQFFTQALKLKAYTFYSLKFRNLTWLGLCEVYNKNCSGLKS